MPKRKRSPRRRIPLAVIGCGGFVHSHVGAICDHVPEFRFVAMVDTDRSHAEHLAGMLPEDARPPIFSDYRNMLAEVRPAAVIVSSPHTLHFRHGYDALGAGAHVMIEKPMVTSADDARKLVRRARAKKLALNIAIQGIHTDYFAYTRELLNGGRLGRLQMVTGLLAQGWLEMTRGSWRQNPRLSGGGQLYDSMAHVLSTMMAVVDSPVREVFCWTDNKGSRVDINAVGTIRFANGVMAAITSGGNSFSGCLTRLTFQAEHGAIDMSPHSRDFHLYDRTGPVPVAGVPKRFKVKTVTPARNFADVILGRAEPRCDGRLGILLADLMDALYASARTGKPVKVTRR